jgi:hypothetical protein
MSEQRPAVERLENDPRLEDMPTWAQRELAPHAWRHSLPEWESTRQLYEFAVQCVGMVNQQDLEELREETD